MPPPSTPSGWTTSPHPATGGTTWRPHGDAANFSPPGGGGHCVCARACVHSARTFERVSMCSFVLCGCQIGGWVGGRNPFKGLPPRNKTPGRTSKKSNNKTPLAVHSEEGIALGTSEKKKVP